MDPETIDLREALDEAFENVVILDVRSDPPDDEVMPGEFDIL